MKKHRVSGVAFEAKARIRSEGSPAYTLNLLTAAGIRVSEVKINGDTMCFTVGETLLPLTQKTLSDNGREYSVESVSGLKIKFRELLSRYALIIGAVISCGLIYVYSTFISEVEIRGNAEIASETISAIVDEYVKTPSLFGSPDFDEIEKAVAACDGIAYATVMREGKRLIVEVVEELPETEITDTYSPIPVLARESGTVTKVVTLRGTAAVESGDTVQAGQILIAPYVSAGEGEDIPVRAMGIVEARVTRTEELEYTDEASFTSNAAADIEARKQAFVASLGANELFTGSSFTVKKLDKSIIISIYYEIITRIS